MATTHSQNQEKHTQNMKNEVRQRKPIPFYWRLEKKWCKNECFLKWDTECLRERNGEESEQSQKFEGKTKTQFKNCL